MTTIARKNALISILFTERSESPHVCSLSHLTTADEAAQYVRDRGMDVQQYHSVDIHDTDGTVYPAVRGTEWVYVGPGAVVKSQLAPEVERKNEQVRQGTEHPAIARSLNRDLSRQYREMAGKSYSIRLFKDDAYEIVEYGTFTWHEATLLACVLDSEGRTVEVIHDESDTVISRGEWEREDWND